MQIIRIRTVEPKIPVSSGAVRYHVTPYWADSIGGEPTLADVLAVVNPPMSPIELALENGAALKRRRFEKLARVDPIAALLMKEGIE